MPRRGSGFYNTIEYIGPRPQKPKRKNFFGGWVIIVIAVGMGYYFGKPLISSLNANNAEASMEQADSLISTLRTSKTFGNQLAAAALGQTVVSSHYDPAYYKIPYPNGDVPADKGVAADVVVRTYRKMDMDLQQLVHEDMRQDFRPYPQLWDATAPDPNIDHRRVENLAKFFERKGQTLSTSRNATDYKPGDVVVWTLANAETHIGIVVPGPGEHSGEPWVVHNLKSGVKWENVLFDYSIQRHYRFPADEVK
ncbi:DUF1287 domain-containing protein [Luteolibacter yonseiensis]|uniref:DUF1287 domain-containing protein n=1 Tax=Luteolibacter yonseiensis TaxID=1144680 RepID=A0A934R3S3_9BACT|nr:DUF1287 domain-containing protein [Luteolibacter yonseiensis]MBK1814684.1 DUF1287 domain-containing protein [Luteolibacter yonseiensis]